MTGILIDTETGDLLLERGMVAIGDTAAQTAEAVITAMRGEFKEMPLLGGEVQRQLGGGIDVMWTGDVRKMLQSCGLDVERVELTDDGIVTIE